MNHYRTAWISDLHLGSRGCKAGAILHFLKNHEFDTLYLVGDIIDIWALRRGVYWPQEHNDVIQKLLRKARKGTRLVYLPGNHDEFIDGFLGKFGNITIQRQAVHETVSGGKILVMHGHELDPVAQNLGWLAHVGDIGYKVLLELNGPVNFFRRLLGYQYWSLSAYVKNEVKNVVSFISKFEEAVVHYAADRQVDAVLCGHIHRAAAHPIGGVHYYNTGDWVESCTAIVENTNGELELKSYDIDANHEAELTTEAALNPA
jgi:UDP-2,3-diacylglucosamine pyrophosphatase LpxH